MNCDICSKTFGHNRKPICPSCAIATVYEPQFSHAKALVQNERIRRDLDAIDCGSVATASLPPDSSTVDLIESAKRISVQDQRAQIALIESRLAGIRKQQDSLRAQIDWAREENAARRAAQLDRRASDGREKAALQQLVQSAALIDPLRADSSRLKGRLVKIRDRTADGRFKLCRETATLTGLGIRRRRLRDGQIKEEVVIGGLAVPDLREINLARPDHLSASLASVCRLLMVTCCYLCVRLPAEIMPPRPDHPRPTILSVQSSYQGKHEADRTFLAHKASQSRIDSGRSARPKHRLLSIEKPLPHLAKDDPATYNLFVEGVTLLAYNVAWLSRSQGLNTRIDQWEDVCALGRNLHQLFLGPPTLSKPGFGEFSHATSWHKNLAGPEGGELMVRTWELAPIATISDKVKSFLLTEMSGAEWELLDEAEWTQEREDERAVLVGGGGGASASSASASTAVTVAAADGRNADEGPSGTPDRSGAKGWTKLKSRTNET